MKVRLGILILVMIGACKTERQEDTSHLKLAIFLDSFNTAYPKYYEFESTEEQGDSLLKYAFLDGSQKRSLLVDYPFILHDIGKSLEGQFYAHFIEGTSLKPDWNLSLDFIVPVTEEGKSKLKLKDTYTLADMKDISPVTEVWNYNVDLPNGTNNYLIRENGNTMVIGLGTNYATAVIVKR